MCPPPSVAPLPVRAKPQLLSSRSSHQHILFHVTARQSEPWGRCCCLLSCRCSSHPRAVPLPLVPSALGSPLHWGPSLGCLGSGRGGCACTLPAALRAGCMGRDLGGPGRGQSVPEEPLHAQQCAPKVAWARVTHRAGGTQGCSPELWCSSGPPGLREPSLL